MLANQANEEQAKLAIVLDFDLEKRRIIREREEADFQANLQRTRDHASALSEVFRGLTDSGLRYSSKWAQGLAATGEGIRGVGAAITKVDPVTKKLAGSTERYAGAGAAALGAASQWIKGERRKAAVLAAMELAHAASTFATPWVSAAHVAAAGLYTAVAGGAFAGGGGRAPKTVYRAPEAATSSNAGNQTGAVTYVFNYRGPTSGRDAARETAKYLNANVGLVQLHPDLVSSGAGRA